MTELRSTACSQCTDCSQPGKQLGNTRLKTLVLPIEPIDEWLITSLVLVGAVAVVHVWGPKRESTVNDA